VSLKSMEKSVWANYAYPSDQGLTVITFPLAENSRYMVFDAVLEPESENFMYWAEHADVISYYPEQMTVTDIDGNTYSLTGSSGSSARIPESEKSHGINGLLSYKIETILTLDRPLEAPVASIEISQMSITFGGLSRMGYYTFTIPELNKTVEKEALPRNGLMFDSNGITIQVDSVTSKIDKPNNTYDVCLNTGGLKFAFAEKVRKAYIIPEYIKPDDIGSEKAKFTAGSVLSYYDENATEDAWDIYSKDIKGYGDLKVDSGSIDVSFGDEIAVKIGTLNISLQGEWFIDFTKSVNAAE